ncbi:hypothetical protein PPMP20_37990 [Paraburkholderia phymatum]|uniref:hypothetical protein n=1 Tax=Paraburkholderia phymatum TaxID=148447 RepID=UPI0002EE1134|nr:hypothetical protein [Paraburkholderia phymatum]
MTGYDGIRTSLALALADDAVRALVLDVDSDGGHIAGCLDLADLIYAARKVKPIIAILSETACGTAYVLASACEVVTVPRRAAPEVSAYSWHTWTFRRLSRALA